VASHALFNVAASQHAIYEENDGVAIALGELLEVAESSRSGRSSSMESAWPSAASRGSSGGRHLIKRVP